MFLLWAHVLAMGGPWWSWTINYTHFTLETLGAVLGVVYIFWSEKAKGSVASVPPSVTVVGTFSGGRRGSRNSRCARENGPSWSY